MAAPSAAWTQTAPPPPPSIAVAPVLFLQVGSETALTVGIAGTEREVSGTFLVLRGLPPLATLSKGYVIAPGVWSVPADGLGGLSLALAETALGRWTVSLDLITADNARLAAAKTVIVVSPPGSSAAAGSPLAPAAETTPPAGTPTPAPKPAPTPAPAPALAVPTDQQRALELYFSGEEQMRNGHVYAARQFFELAANLGLAQASLTLGDTYEASELAKRAVVGLAPDATKARRWYELARLQGAADADERLRRLGP